MWRRTKVLSVVVGLAGTLLATILVQAQQPPAPRRTRLTPQEIFKIVSPSVFIVEVLDSLGKTVERGNGVAIGPNQVVTHKALVEGHDRLRVRQGNETWEAKILAFNSYTGPVLLEIEGLAAEPLQQRAFSTLSAGEKVYAVGFSDLSELAYTEGVITNLREFSFGSVIETTTPKVSSAVGGALVDTQGRLIGITTQTTYKGRVNNLPVSDKWIPTAEHARVVDDPEANARGITALAQTWVVLGNKRYEASEYGKAIEAYREAIRVKPDYDVAWYSLGLTYETMTERREALQAYREAIRLNPDHAEAWHNLGYTHEKMGEYQEALEAFGGALRARENYPKAWSGLGIAYSRLGESQKSIRAFREAIRLQPDYAEVWYNLGVAHGKAGQNDDAIKALLEAIRLDPGNAAAWYNIGVVYATVGQQDKALGAYREATRLEQNFAEAWHNLGFTYEKFGRIQNAIDAYRKAIGAKPDYIEAWYKLGMLYAAQGNKDQTLVVYKKLQILDPATADEFFQEIILP